MKMCEIITNFRVFDRFFTCLPKGLVENIQCFFVTEKSLKYRGHKTGYFITKKDNVYAAGTHIHQMIKKTNNKSFALIPELCKKGIEEFFDGYYFMFARSKDNQIFGWRNDKVFGTYSIFNLKVGTNGNLIYFEDKNIIEISCGINHCLALSSDGVLYGLGDNKLGQLNFDPMTECISDPTMISMNEEMSNKIKSVHCYENQSYVITISGVIYQLTGNGFKRKFDFNETVQNTSLDQNCDQIKVIDITFVKNSLLLLWTKDNVFEYDIECNDIRKTNSDILNKYFLLENSYLNDHSTHKTIHLRDNQLFVIKCNQKNQISENQLLKTSETIISDVNNANIKQFFEDFEQKTVETEKLKQFKFFDDLPKDIESDVKCYYFTDFSKYSSALFVMSDSKVYGFGCNEWGNLGFGHNRRVHFHTIIPELCDQNIEEFFDGKHCMFARNDKNQIFGWGRNNYGQLGRGHKSEENEFLKPLKIDFFDDKNIVQISCDKWHCLALSANGLVYGWGRNDCGQAGISNPKEDILKPIEYKTNVFVRSVICFPFTSLLISSEGEAIVFGFAEYYINIRDYSNEKPLTHNVLEQMLAPIKLKKISDPYNGYDNVALSEDGILYYLDISKNTIKPIESEVKFTDIHEKNNTIALQSEEFVYELQSFGRIYKTDYLNFYNYYSHKRSIITYKPIHITSDGFLITKDIKFNRNYNKTNEKRLEIEDKNIFDNKYDKQFEVCNKIGSGSFGTVIEVKSKLDKSSYAIKIIKIEDEFSKILREVKILSKLWSGFVVEFIDSWIEAKYEHRIPVNYLYIQMDFCSQNLKQFIESMDRISEERFKTFKYFFCCELSKELIECVDYLHSLNPPIIHRDLKPENILISDGSRYIRLCDFGLAKVFHEKSKHTRCVGSGSYMAPEVRDYEDYNQMSDVYSLALVITQIFQFKGTLKEIRDSKDLSNYLSTYVTSSLSHESEKLRETLSLCIHSHDYNQRPNCKELLKSFSEWSIDKERVLKDENITEFKTFLREPKNELFKDFFERKSENWDPDSDSD